MTFIDRYLEYATPQTGAPRQYHFYAAYAILATVIGRRATYHGAGGAKGPNLWMVILGPSSMAYKSTVTNIMSGVLREFYEPQAKEFLLPSSGSFESFVEVLSERSQGILINDEFVSVLDWMDKKYNGELTGLLTKLYDYGSHTFTRRVGTRKNAQTYTITDPFINAFYCSTFEWFNQKMNEGLIMGGFIPRHILIHVDAPSTMVPITPPADLALRDSLVSTLSEINTLPLGPMDYTPQAKKAFIDWYKELVPRISKDANSMLQPILHRRMADTHKFAMVHAAMRSSPLEMNMDDLDKATRITEDLIQMAAFIVGGKINLNPFQAARQKVLDLITRYQHLNGVEGAPRHLILKYAKMKARDFDEIIQTLEQEGLIEIIPTKLTGGRPSSHYRLTEQLVEA